MYTFGSLSSRTIMLFIGESKHFLLMMLTGLTYTIVFLIINKNAFRIT